MSAFSNTNRRACGSASGAPEFGSSARGRPGPAPRKPVPKGPGAHLIWGFLLSASRTARTLVATGLAAGAVVSALAMPAVAADHGSGRAPVKSAVELGRIQYDSPGRDDNSNRSRNAEWVEVRNTSRKAVNLDGWTLTAKSGKRYTFHDFRLQGRSTVRVHTGVGRDSRTDAFQDRRNYVWDNKRDKAVLKDRRGHVIDTKSWNRR